MKNNLQKILVVAAHPDDELLGVAGTLIRHVQDGDEVHVLILGDGESSRSAETNIVRRADLARTVAKELGAKSVALESFSDNQFDLHSLLSIVKIVERCIETIRPHTIYTHHIHDLNIDHRYAVQAVLTAARPMEGQSVRKILSFETVSATEWQAPRTEFAFCPNEYVNIENTIEEKVRLLKIYEDEMRQFPHPRSYEGVRILAQKRGMEVGYWYAEAFEVIRNLRN